MIEALQTLLDQAQKGLIVGLLCLAQFNEEDYRLGIHGECWSNPEKVYIPACRGLQAFTEHVYRMRDA